MFILYSINKNYKNQYIFITFYNFILTVIYPFPLLNKAILPHIFNCFLKSPKNAIHPATFRSEGLLAEFG